MEMATRIETGKEKTISVIEMKDIQFAVVGLEVQPNHSNKIVATIIAQEMSWEACLEIISHYAC